MGTTTSQSSLSTFSSTLRQAVTYDALNRATLKPYPSGSTPDLYWAYDLLNRQLYAHYGSAGGAGVDTTYDALGRAVSSSASGRTLSYQYDAAGNRTRITWPDSGANALYVTYLYDVLNRVTQIQENGATSGAGLLATFPRAGALWRRANFPANALYGGRRRNGPDLPKLSLRVEFHFNGQQDHLCTLAATHHEAA